MFDTQSIGKRIAFLRKEKDMTQMDLADQMMVSYQAVSNWERGNSMPDISKLGDLARILGVGIEDLLGSRPETEIVRKAIETPEDLSINEVAKVAPMLKPSQFDAALEDAEDEEIDASTLVYLAPYLSSDKLMSMAQKVKFSDLSELTGIAPFLESEHLARLVKRQSQMTGSLGSLTALAPYLESDQIRMFLEPLEPQAGGFAQLVGLAPFMEEEDLSAVAGKFFEQDRDGSQLVAIAPFMDSDALGAMFRKMTLKEQMDSVRGLAPFMDGDDLTEVAREHLKQGNFKILKDLLPFIDTEGL